MVESILSELVLGLGLDACGCWSSTEVEVRRLLLARAASWSGFRLLVLTLTVLPARTAVAWTMLPFAV
jgi:hypothetical protein